MRTEPFPQEKLTIANVLVIIAIPCVVGSALWGVSRLIDPLFSRAPTAEESSYANLPKTPAQIQEELQYHGLYLGDRLDLPNKEVLYAVMENDFQGMQELRIYQELADKRLVLHRLVPINGLDEYVVRSPVQKFALKQDQATKINPNSRRRWVSLPLTKLQFIPSPSQLRSGVWLTATGTIDGILYGRILYYDQSPQRNLKILAEWTSPANELPQWRRFLNLAATQLVVDQTQRSDPKYQVFLLETGNRMQLREVKLPQSPKIKGLAEAGLWSLAKAQLDTLRAERILNKSAFSEREQEAYELVSAHGELLQRQITNKDRQEPDNISERAYFYLLDGRWQLALDLIQQNPKLYPPVSAMLAQKYPHIWLRVRSAQQFAPEVESLPAIKTWGALASLPRIGFRQTEVWLKQQQANTQANLTLLQRLDLQPLGIEPTQLVGSVKFLGAEVTDQWFLPPPALAEGQTWFVIEIDLMRDRQSWLSSPFPQIADRSSLFLWRALRLEQNRQIRITTSTSRQVFNLTVQSFWVGDQGRLRLLAQGDQAIAELITQEAHPPIAVTGLLPVMGQNLALPVSYLPEPLKTNLVSNLYQELQALSPPSISLEQFAVIAGRWRFQTIDFNADGQGELFMTLTREQVNAGDRSYPLAVIFDQQGKILFSDIDLKTRGQRWLYNLVAETKQPIPILIEVQGRFQLRQIKP